MKSSNDKKQEIKKLKDLGITIPKGMKELPSFLVKQLS